MRFIGKINIELFQAAISQQILTDEVILTGERAAHIAGRRGQAFLDEYLPFFSEIIASPDYIFQDDRESTVLVCKTVSSRGESVNLVIRLAVEGDNPNYKNSILTAVKENPKRFAQRLRNRRPLFNRFDNTE